MPIGSNKKFKDFQRRCDNFEWYFCQILRAKKITSRDALLPAGSLGLPDWKSPAKFGKIPDRDRKISSLNLWDFCKDTKEYLNQTGYFKIRVSLSSALFGPLSLAIPFSLAFLRPSLSSLAACKCSHLLAKWHSLPSSPPACYPPPFESRRGVARDLGLTPLDR